MGEHIRRRSPFPVGPGERPAPSVVNKGGIWKGVVKLGWSWEGRFVLSFEGEEQLAARLREMMLQPGCTASCCIVQEWVDFDFEMRLYFLPPTEWPLGTTLEPTRIEFNAWSGSMENGQRRSFHKLTSDSILAEYWEQDSEALESAKKQAMHTSQYLVSWLRSLNAQPVPMVRLDFMLLRMGPGKAQ